MGTEFDARWEMRANTVLSGMKKWRRAHPKATLAEIDATLDERMARLRAQLREDSARARCIPIFPHSPLLSGPCVTRVAEN